MTGGGTSVYLGLGALAAAPEQALEPLSALGLTELFTSLQIPEADLRPHRQALIRLGAWARRHGWRLIADLSPQALTALGARPENLEPLAELGVAVARLDAGFDGEAVRRMRGNRWGIELMFNATTAADAEQELAGHLVGFDFYPRRDTGLALAWAQQRADALHARGAVVQAFVASQVTRRGPFYEGLPTLERHRGLEPWRAAMELLVRRLADIVVVGDPSTDPRELGDLAAVLQAPHLRLRVRPDPQAPPAAQAVAFGRLHRAHPASAENVVRAAGLRGRPEAAHLPAARRLVGRPLGTVTVDGAAYGRYAGELQITRVDLPPDPRVLTVGHVLADDLELLALLQPGRPFELLPVDGPRWR